MSEENKIRIFLADDHQIFIEGVKTVLMDNNATNCEIVGEANCGSDLLKQIKKSKADLLLLDMNMPDMDGLEVLTKIRDYDKHLRIIILTMYDEAKIVKSAFKSGVDGYILKGNGVQELYKAIDEVMLGNTFMGKNVVLHNVYGQKNGKKKWSISYQDRFVKKIPFDETGD